MTLVGTLHPYQDEPVDKFLERGNLLVAYEMGLGKTVIGIAAAEELLDDGAIDCCMIVCPANLRWQWAQRIAQFTDLPTIEKKIKDQTIIIPAPKDVLVIDGPPTKRMAMYASIESGMPDYILLSYETVVNDWKYISKIHPGMVVLDEATAIKTFRAKRTRKIKQLTAPWRLALTGTPVENKPEELFSIMQWVDKDVLGRYDLFDKSYIVRNNFGGVQRYKNLGTLHKRLLYAMCRKNRLDDDVAPYLPRVDHGTWSVGMDPGTKGVYSVMAGHLLESLAQVKHSGDFDVHAHYNGGQIDESTEMGKIMAKQQALEMLLDHPDLCVYSAQDYADKSIKRGSKYLWERWQEGLFDDVTTSNKLNMLVEEVEKIMEFSPDNKVIIFTKYVDMLFIIEEALPYKSVLYHGQMSGAEKAGAVAQITNDPSTRLFLSSHAGAYGTDMYMVNYLINYDLPWSSGKADQINGRHIRASSEFDKVFIRDMITEGTIEKRKYDILSMKRKVGTAILDHFGADETGTVENDVESLTSYLTAGLID